MAMFDETTSLTETACGREKFVAFGVLLVSAMIAVLSAGLSVYLGHGWLGTVVVFFATGASASFGLLLFLIVNEMRKQDMKTQATIPPRPASGSQDCLGRAA